MPGTIRYRVGNENSPVDPWGRSELVITPDGSARLEHHFSRARHIGTWTGKVEEAALARFWAGLERAGFPAVPPHQLVADATIRHLVVESGNGPEQQAFVDRHQTASLPGYAEAFDILDGVIRRLSGDAVSYPTSQGAIVQYIEAV